jgi:hypothetical protein
MLELYPFCGDANALWRSSWRSLWPSRPTFAGGSSFRRWSESPCFCGRYAYEDLSGEIVGGWFSFLYWDHSWHLCSVVSVQVVRYVQNHSFVSPLCVGRLKCICRMSCGMQVSSLLCPCSVYPSSCIHCLAIISHASHVVSLSPQATHGQVDTSWACFYGLFVAAFSLLFTEVWKRKQSEYRAEWGMLRFKVMNWREIHIRHYRINQS